MKNLHAAAVSGVFASARGLARHVCHSGRRAAERLNAEGFRPPRRGNRFTTTSVLQLAARLGLTRRERYGSQMGLGPDEFRSMGLARRLGVSRDRIGGWLRSGYLNVRKDEDGYSIIWADADELKRLRELGRLFRAGATGARLAELKQPKPCPQR